MPFWWIPEIMIIWNSVSNEFICWRGVLFLLAFIVSPPTCIERHRVPALYLNIYKSITEHNALWAKNAAYLGTKAKVMQCCDKHAMHIWFALFRRATLKMWWRRKWRAAKRCVMDILSLFCHAYDSAVLAHKQLQAAYDWNKQSQFSNKQKKQFFW